MATIMAMTTTMVTTKVTTTERVCSRGRVRGSRGPAALVAGDPGWVGSQ